MYMFTFIVDLYHLIAYSLQTSVKVFKNQHG